MMSFLGSIGTLMSSSGLSNALELCYGPNAVLHMMSGKHVSHALRGHFLANAAIRVTLMKRILPTDDEECPTKTNESSNSGRLTATELNSIKCAYDRAFAGCTDQIDDVGSDALRRFTVLLQDTEEKLSVEFRTAKLWFLYLLQMHTLKLFICAERTGDWELH